MSEPGPGVNQPTDGQKQTADGQNQPADGQNQPTDGQNQTSPGVNQPNVGQNQTSPGVNQPTTGVNQPTVGENQPNVVDNQPNVVHNQPKVDQNQPTVVHNQPNVDQNQPTPGVNQPTVGENQPIVQQNQPIVRQNHPIVGHNQPTLASSIRTILIVNGTSTLGAVTARLFCRSGWRVAVGWDYASGTVTALINELKALSPLRNDPSISMAVPVYLDLRSLSSIKSCCRHAATLGGSASGHLHAVFSNTFYKSVPHTGKLKGDNVSDWEWERCFNINVKIHLYILLGARAYMEPCNGAFITEACWSGFQPFTTPTPALPGVPTMAWSATKAAQIHMVRLLAVAVQPTVRVNCVSPRIIMNSQFEVERPQDVAVQIYNWVVLERTTGMNIIIGANGSRL